MSKIRYFHDVTTHHSTFSADVIIPIVKEFIDIQSVVDVGCGLGAWLVSFEKNGVSDIFGIDGTYIDKSKLLIDEKFFRSGNLGTLQILDRKYDLAICLEVAEHLSENEADTIVKSLVGMSDNILFSAAIIGQGGQNHLNEQWFMYWQNKFLQHGYIFNDVVRPLIWNNESVDWWYRQNIFLVSKTRFTPKNSSELICGYHPTWFNLNAVYLSKLESGDYSVKSCLKYLIRAIKRKLFS